MEQKLPESFHPSARCWCTELWVSLGMSSKDRRPWCHIATQPSHLDDSYEPEKSREAENNVYISEEFGCTIDRLDHITATIELEIWENRLARIIAVHGLVLP